MLAVVLVGCVVGSAWAFGKDWFEVKEGEASIFKPDGNGRVPIDQWTAAKQ